MGGESAKFTHHEFLLYASKFPGRLAARMTRQAVAAGEEHYAIKYNAFMGVRDDYYLAEERSRAAAIGDQGTGEWTTAAAKPVGA